MLRFFKQLSLTRWAWFLVFISSATLEIIALYFQHGLGLAPCVMCIYERLALFAIMFAGVLGFIAPKSALCRWGGLLLGLYGSIKGAMLAIKHTDYQLNPAPWNQCSPFVDFPETLPLHLWFPNVFAPSGDCSKISWEWLGLSMPQWLIGVFAFYAIIFIVVSLSQITSKSTTQRSIFR